MGGRAVWGFFLAATLAVSAGAVDSNGRTGTPGTLNYVEGTASIGNEAVDSKSIGNALLQPGQSLTTETGKAELLLTPGVFLRVGNASSVKMISPSLTDTELELDQGHAIVEVDEIHPQNSIRVNAAGSSTQLLKTGLYDFDLRSSQLRVYDGEAMVREGDKSTKVKGGHEIALNSTTAKLKSDKFDKKSDEQGDLYRWSSLRSSYIAEANVDAAGMYAVNGAGPWGPGWWGAGWYWDPYFSAFTFIPGDGIFYSPFGWGFYSPWFVGYAPFWGFGWGGYGYRPFYHHFGPDYHTWGPGNHYVGSAGYGHGVYRGPGSNGGFRSGGRGLTGGGFGGPRGGGARAGGFNGGGFHGGGFHGGVGFHGGGGFHGR